MHLEGGLTKNVLCLARVGESVRVRCTTALGLLRAYLLAQSGLFPSSILSPGCMLLFVCGMTPGNCVCVCVCVCLYLLFTG